MIELFRQLSERSIGTLQIGQWPYIQKGLWANIEKIQDYHRRYPVGVRSDHFLIRLLTALSIPRNLGTERYHASVDRVALNVSQSLGMTSAQNAGKFFRGTFYGGHTPELLLATDDWFDAEEVHEKWEFASPVTVLLNAKSDLGMHLPDGKAYSEEEGITVIQINIPMLAVMYRAFEQAQLKQANGAPKTVAQFIGGYVIPNMLPSHMELCLFNRIHRALTGVATESNVPWRKHPFFLPQYDYYTDNALERALDNIQKTSLEFVVVLNQIPALYHKTMYQALEMPDVAPTRQVDYALILARLKMVAFLFKVCEKNLRNRNQVQINQILRAFRLNDVYKVFLERLPSDVLQEAVGYINIILHGADREFF